MRHPIGKFGEVYLATRLECKGYNIVSRNYHSRFGEIDIMAFKNNTLHIFEVKTTKTNISDKSIYFEKWNQRQKYKMVATLSQFLSRYGPVDSHQKTKAHLVIIDLSAPNKVKLITYTTTLNTYEI